jgi:hypothetical protein
MTVAFSPHAETGGDTGYVFGLLLAIIIVWFFAWRLRKS